MHFKEIISMQILLQQRITCGLSLWAWLWIWKHGSSEIRFKTKRKACKYGMRWYVCTQQLCKAFASDDKYTQNYRDLINRRLLMVFAQATVPAEHSDTYFNRTYFICNAIMLQRALVSNMYFKDFMWTGAPLYLWVFGYFNMSNTKQS